MSLLESISQKTYFVPEDTSICEVAFLIAGSDAGVIGITRDGHAIGTITDYDLMKRSAALGNDLSKLSAKHVMEHRPVTVEWLSDDSDLIDAAILMRRANARNAIVTQGGVPVGVVSFGMLSRYTLGDFD